MRSAVSILVVTVSVGLPYWRCGSRSSPAPFGAVGLLKQGLRLGECPYGQAAKAYSEAGYRALGRGGRGTPGGGHRPEVPAEPVAWTWEGGDLCGLPPNHAESVDVTGVVFKRYCTADTADFSLLRALARLAAATSLLMSAIGKTIRAPERPG